MVIFAAWIVGVLLLGYVDVGIWTALPAAVLIAYLKRGWHADNGVGPERAVVIGSIFAFPAAIGLYFLGSWISTLI